MREETGLDVEQDRLTGSYSRPDGAGTVLIRCKVIGGQLTSSNCEIAEVRFFDRARLPEGLSAAGRARTRDAFSGDLGFVRMFNAQSREYE